MNFWSVKNVQKYYNCINPSLSTVQKFYAMLHQKYYGPTTLIIVFKTGLIKSYLNSQRMSDSFHHMTESSESSYIMAVPGHIPY